MSTAVGLFGMVTRRMYSPFFAYRSAAPSRSAFAKASLPTQAVQRGLARNVAWTDAQFRVFEHRFLARLQRLSRAAVCNVSWVFNSSIADMHSRRLNDRNWPKAVPVPGVE